MPFSPQIFYLFCELVIFILNPAHTALVEKLNVESLPREKVLKTFLFFNLFLYILLILLLCYTHIHTQGNYLFLTLAVCIFLLCEGVINHLISGFTNPFLMMLNQEYSQNIRPYYSKGNERKTEFEHEYSK